MTVAASRAIHDTPAPVGHELEAGTAFGSVLDHRALHFTPEGAMPLETVTYGTGGRGGRDLELWLHRRRDRTGRAPGIVFVHGGGWAGGMPVFHGRHAHAFAARGWVTASITYRLSPEARWPACLEDVKCAIRWMRAHADELGVDPDRIVVAGGSAGGHLVTMAALTAGRFEGTGGHEAFSSEVQAAVAWYPASDLRAAPIQPFLELLMPGATSDEMLAASPVGQIHAAAPPILTMTGDADQLTELVHIERFHDALDDLGARNELMIFRGRDHGFDFHPQDWVVCFDRMVEFLEGALATAGA